MAVDKLNPQSLGLFFGQYQRQINLLVVVLLAIYLLAFLADLVWRIIPEPKNNAQNAGQVALVGQTPTTGNSARADIRALQQLNLFGDIAAETAPVQEEAVTDAPETRLSLVLTGVVASSNLDFGTAVIEHRGSQAVYGIGEKIEGTNASLHQVQTDRVIIKNGVRNETLMLEGIDYDEANRAREQDQRQTARQQPATRAPSGPTPSSRLSEEAVEATQQLRSSPDSFIDFISIVPHRENNQMLGYRLSPGKNPALFEAAGLQSGDVVTQINGLDVTDPQQSMEAMGELRSAEIIELTVTREGELLTLYLELPEA